MANRKRLLFATDLFPYPFEKGQSVRVLNLLAACGKGFDVTFVGPRPGRESDGAMVERHCADVAYLQPAPSSWRENAPLFLRTARVTPSIPRPPAVRRYVPYVAALESVNPASFDVVWAERPHMAQLLASERKRTVLDLDDLEHVKASRRLAIQRGPIERARTAYQYLLYRRIELGLSRQFLGSIVCSEEDRLLLEKSGCKNGYVVPNAPASLGANVRASARRKATPEGPLRVVFLGNVASEPNLDAIEYFATDVLPLLREADPQTVFEVIGPNADEAIRARYEGRVHFRGFVDDLGAALAEYDVHVAPLRFGGGTKLKVLDAMSQGIPVVTTGVGAEGLSLRDGEHVLLAERPAEIAEAILRVKRDGDLAERLTASAYVHVRNRFSWDAIQDRLAEWLLRIAPTRSV